MQKKELDLAYVLFFLLDAQIGIAARLKGATKQRVKQLFERSWRELRALSEAVYKSANDIEKINRINEGEIEDSFAEASDFIILAVKAKIEADRNGTAQQLETIIKSFANE